MTIKINNKTINIIKLTRMICFTLSPVSRLKISFYLIGIMLFCSTIVNAKFLPCNKSYSSSQAFCSASVELGLSYVTPPISVNDDNVTFINLPVSGKLGTNDFDLDSNLLLYSSISVPPINGTVVLGPDGSYTYSPNPNFTGTDVFEYLVCDGFVAPFCESGITHITILPLQDDPTKNNLPIPNQDDNITYTNWPIQGNVLSNDYDCESTNLTLTSVVAAPNNGSLVVNPNGFYMYTPNPGFTGRDQFSYEVCDDGFPVGCATSIVYLSVLDNNTNNKPPFAGDDFEVTAMDAPVSSDVFVNDNDPDGDPFMVTKANGTAVGSSGATFNSIHGTITIFQDGSYTYKPDAGYTGPDQFTYQICDAAGCSNGTVYLMVFTQICVNAQLTVFLEGATVDPTNGQYLYSMRTDLNTVRSLLPGQTPVHPNTIPTPAGQPYNITPFNYPGTPIENAFAGPYPPNIVDWILVSFRKDILPASKFKQAAGLLQRDGTIIFIPQSPLTSSDTSDMYLVIEHRNHMGIMTTNPVNVVNNTITHDFTKQNSYTGNVGFGQLQIHPGVWAMYAGDCNQDADFQTYEINGNDRILWKIQNGLYDSYLLGDINMDADCNSLDKILINKNNGISSRVPK